MENSEFEEMMKRLIIEDGDYTTLDEGILEVLRILVDVFSIVYDEMIMSGFDEDKCFEFATKFTLNLSNMNVK